MWDSEMVTLLRHIIDDISEPPKYTDDRLRQLLLVAAQFTQGENVLIQDYTINIDNQTMKPDPTNGRTGIRDDAFINLTILKAACLLARGSLLKAAKQHIAVIEASYKFDAKGRLDGQQVVAKSWCDAYKDAQWEHTMQHRDPGRAIIGPYRSLLARGDLARADLSNGDIARVEPYR